MKLKEGVLVNEIDDQVMAVDAGNGRERFSGLVRMNKTAGFVAGLLQKETSLEEIVKAMTQEYDITEEVARANAQKVIDAFQGAGLME